MKIIRKLLATIRGIQNLDKLKKRGLTLGRDFKMMEGCIIDPSHCWHIKIGDNVTLAPKVHILAHDASTKFFLNYTKVGNVEIGDNVFVGSSSTVLPSVKIGSNVIIGSGSVVTKDVPSNSVAVGVPAKVICSLDEYLLKEKNKMLKENLFDESFTLRNAEFSEKQKEILVVACGKYGTIYVE